MGLVDTPKKLERFKFGVYLLVPIMAVVLYSVPAIHEWFLTERRYIVYTPSDIPDFQPGVRRVRARSSIARDAAAAQGEEGSGAVVAGGATSESSGRPVR